jgi:hypothetical protein
LCPVYFLEQGQHHTHDHIVPVTLGGPLPAPLLAGAVQRARTEH